MSVDLYDNQKKAVASLSSGSILCGDVGTGKSRTALAYFYTKVCGGKLPRKGSSNVVPPYPKPLYIITTAKKRDDLDWEQELSYFCMPANMPITIDSWNNIKKYQDAAGGFFIFDEQRLVGTGAWTKSFQRIARNNEWILLTATPGDVWLDYAQVFIANGFYKNITEFRNKHVVYHRFTKYPKVEKYVNIEKLEKLKNAILVRMDSTKIATHHHSWVKVGYSEEDYELALKQRWNIYKQEPARNASEMCYLLRKIVNDDIRRCNAIVSILKNHPKAIIFYSFDYELEKLRHLGDAIGVPYSEWNGHRHEPIRLEEKTWMYFVNYSSGSEGWNCIETDTMIFYSLNYSYRTMVQACGRIDRLNTPYKDLFYYHIFSDSSIDNAIRRCIDKKKKFNEQSFFDSIASR